jgi:hypothetical protein
MKRFSVSLRESQYDRLKEFADLNHWSISTATAWLIEKGLQDRGKAGYVLSTAEKRAGMPQ